MNAANAIACRAGVFGCCCVRPLGGVGTLAAGRWGRLPTLPMRAGGAVANTAGVARRSGDDVCLCHL